LNQVVREKLTEQLPRVATCTPWIKIAQDEECPQRGVTRDRLRLLYMAT
jgi:hypothetical protein